MKKKFKMIALFMMMVTMSFPNLVYAENPPVGEDEYIDELRSYGVSEENIEQFSDDPSVRLNMLTINNGSAAIHFKMYFEPNNNVFKISDTNIVFDNSESGISFYYRLSHYNYDRENHVAECTIVVPATELYHEYWVDVYTMSNGINSTNVTYQYMLNAEAGKEYELVSIAGTKNWIDENAKTLMADYIDAGEDLWEVGTFNQNAVGYQDASKDDTPQILGDYELDGYGKVKIYDLQGRSCGSLDIKYMIDGFTPFESYLALNLYGWDTTVETLPKGFKKLDLYIDNPVYPESELTDEKRAEYEAEGVFDRSPYVEGWEEETTESLEEATETLEKTTEEMNDAVEKGTETISSTDSEKTVKVRRYLPFVIGALLILFFIKKLI